MKILIADDSVVIRSELRKTLEKAGHVVVEAESGVQGLERIGQHPDVNIVIADVNMPAMDGLTMCQMLAANPKNKDIIIIMLTSESTPAMKQRGKEIGVKLWMVKPISPDRLIELLNIVIERNL